MTKRPLPDTKHTENLINTLTDADATVSLASSPWECSDEISYIGTYCTAKNDIRVLIRVDLPLAASLAALLTRFMPAIAKDAITAQTLDGDLFLNLREIMNIFAGKLNIETVDHVIFKDTYLSRDLPKPVTKLMTQTPSERRDFTIEISPYYDGKLSFLSFD